MKKYLEWVLGMWRPVILATIALLVIGFVYGFHLGSLTHGTSAPEQQYLQGVRSGTQILQNPIFLPHKVPVYLAFKLHIGRIAVYRFISALFVVSAITSTFFILKKWYSLRVALLGSVLMLSSAWFLHVGRLAAPDATFVLIVPLMLGTLHLHSTKRYTAALITLSALGPVCLYIPGFVWLVAAIVLWERNVIWSAIKNAPWWARALSGLLAILCLIPFLLGSIHDHGVVLSSLGLPSRFPHLNAIAKNIVHIPAQLFIKGPADPVRWLGRIPILDVFSSVMFGLGLYGLRYKLKQFGAQLLIGCSVILLPLIALGGPVTITAIIPIVHLLSAAGVAFMLQQWMTVFPRNPIARSIATTLMSVTILLVLYYNINHYFIAWPHTPATRHSFNSSLVK